MGEDSEFINKEILFFLLLFSQDPAESKLKVILEMYSDDDGQPPDFTNDFVEGMAHDIVCMLFNYTFSMSNYSQS